MPQLPVNYVICPSVVNGHRVGIGELLTRYGLEPREYKVYGDCVATDPDAVYLGVLPDDAAYASMKAWIARRRNRQEAAAGVENHS